VVRTLGRVHLPPLPCWPVGAWLVGGAVRDLWLGLKPFDYDFATADPRAAARDCAHRSGGTPFPLDEQRGHWRVVAGPATYDFTPLQDGIENDLLRRDFTANALAATPRGAVLGPAQARYDLRHRVLRALSREALDDDPLRPLRGLRLWLTHGLRPEPRTLEWMRRAACAQRFGRQPARERVRDELERMLAHPRAAWAFARLQQLGFAPAYLRAWAAGDGVEQLGYHHLDVLRHELEALFQLVWRFPEAGLELRWAALLHDVAKPLVRQWDPNRGYYRFFEHESFGAAIASEQLGRLRCSRALQSRVAALIRAHMRAPPAAGRARRRWMHRQRRLLPDLLFLQIADRAATRGPRARREGYRLGELYDALEEARTFLGRPQPAPLLNGNEIMERLGLDPGPEVGRLLDLLVEAQVLGDVRTRDEALAFVQWKHESQAAEA